MVKFQIFVFRKQERNLFSILVSKTSKEINSPPIKKKKKQLTRKKIFKHLYISLSFMRDAITVVPWLTSLICCTIWEKIAMFLSVCMRKMAMVKFVTQCRASKQNKFCQTFLFANQNVCKQNCLWTKIPLYT